jgi:spore coat protein A, manganese oxidase
LRKIPGNNKHCVVLSSDIKEASFVAQTLFSQHVCNRGGFFCLQIQELSELAVSDLDRLPDRLSVIETLTPEAAVRTRTFTFGPRPELKYHYPPIYWAINGSRFDPEHAQAQPHLGDVEIWRFVYEKSPWRQTHPPHVHLVNFQILDRNGQAPHEHERGWKDTLRLDSGDDVRVIMPFDGYRGRYLTHCHNLEHEDYDKMMRFDVV